MKKKVCIVLLAMCMALAAGCGEENEMDTTQTEQTSQDGAASSQDGTRLVSVDNVEKYITLGEYKGIVLDNSVQVTEEEVDEAIRRRLQDSMEEVTQKGSTVENGDMVTINYVGTKDGVAFEGGTADNYDLLVGSGLMIPGFEEGIVGMKKGDTKDVTVTFPPDYRSTELAGKEAVFQITLLKFQRAPELTETWVAENTQSVTVEEYRAVIRAELEEEARVQAENSLRDTAWLTVSGNAEVREYPQRDLEEAAAAFRRQAEEYAGQAEMELEDFVESQGISMEDFEAQAQQYAQLKVKQKLVIQGIMDAEGMTLEDPESLAVQERLVQEYGGGDMAGLIDTYGQEAVDETIGLLRVQDFIVANANIETGTPTASGENGSAEGDAGRVEGEADAENASSPESQESTEVS
ncbi:MAG: trigger factor [Eubacteriales bacterium]|nr:trigger factor [Eubacteriales bacterium]